MLYLQIQGSSKLPLFRCAALAEWSAKDYSRSKRYAALRWDAESVAGIAVAMADDTMAGWLMFRSHFVCHVVSPSFPVP